MSDSKRIEGPAGSVGTVRLAHVCRSVDEFLIPVTPKQGKRRPMVPALLPSVLRAEMKKVNSASASDSTSRAQSARTNYFFTPQRGVDAVPRAPQEPLSSSPHRPTTTSVSVRGGQPAVELFHSQRGQVSPSQQQRVDLSGLSFQNIDLDQTEHILVETMKAMIAASNAEQRTSRRAADGIFCEMMAAFTKAMTHFAASPLGAYAIAPTVTPRGSTTTTASVDESHPSTRDTSTKRVRISPEGDAVEGRSMDLLEHRIAQLTATNRDLQCRLDDLRAAHSGVQGELARVYGEYHCLSAKCNELEEALRAHLAAPSPTIH